MTFCPRRWIYKHIKRFSPWYMTAMPYFIYSGNPVADWIIKKCCINMHKIFVPSTEANKRGDELKWEPGGLSSRGNRELRGKSHKCYLQHGVKTQMFFCFCLTMTPAVSLFVFGLWPAGVYRFMPFLCFEKQNEALILCMRFVI